MAEEETNEEFEETQEETEETEETQDEDIKDSFLKGDEKDQHRIASALGRFLKNQGDQEKFNQQVLNTLNQLQENLSRPQETQNMHPDVSKLNEDWQNRILSGDVVGVLDEFSSLKQRAETEISQANANKVNSLVGGLSEEPFFNDLEKGVREMAMSLVQQGKDPQTAVDLAYNKARGNYLAGLVANVHKTNPSALKMARGGSKANDAGSKGKLPPAFKERAAKDISDGLFKDEAEWIANLSPAIRKQHGI